MSEVLQPTLELVTWLDAGTDTDTDLDWRAASDITDSDILIESVGWVVKETDRYLTLAMDYCRHDGISSGRSRIPKGMITRRLILTQ